MRSYRVLSYSLALSVILSFNNYSMANVGTGTVASVIIGGKAVKSASKHKKKIIGGAILAGAGGFIAFNLTKDKFLDMIEHPEDHEDFMLDLIDNHPIKYSTFKKFLDYNIDNTEDEEYKKSLIEFEDFFHIYKEDVVLNKIENSVEYNDYLTNISIRISEIENDYKNKSICDNNYYQKISSNIVEFPQFLKLTKIGLNNIYSVNKYGNFPSVRTGYTPDHIPSYKAVHNFMISKKIKLNKKRRDNPNLDDNLTAITIITNEHRKGSRTYGGRNIKRNVEDAKNLKKATAKDIAFFSAYLLLYEGKNPYEYIRANEVLIKRNFYLCLYN